MRRVDWRTNDGAVALVLLGVVLAALGVSLFGSAVYLNDVESCPSIADAASNHPSIAAACDRVRQARASTVRNLAVGGALFLAAGLATAHRRWWYANEDRRASWGAPAWAVVVPVFPFVAVASAYDSGVLLRTGAAAAAGGVLATWWCASFLRDLTTRAHLLVASAIALPVLCAGVAAVDGYVRRSPSRPWRIQEADLADPQGAALMLLPFVSTAVLFTAAVALARLRRRAPNIWLGAGLFTLSTATVLPVFVPDLVPAWRGFDNPPGPVVWLPILAAPAVVALVVWAIAATRPRP